MLTLTDLLWCYSLALGAGYTTSLFGVHLLWIAPLASVVPSALSFLFTPIAQLLLLICWNSSASFKLRRFIDWSWCARALIPLYTGASLGIWCTPYEQPFLIMLAALLLISLVLYMIYTLDFPALIQRIPRLGIMAFLVAIGFYSGFFSTSSSVMLLPLLLIQGFAPRAALGCSLACDGCLSLGLVTLQGSQVLTLPALPLLSTMGIGLIGVVHGLTWQHMLSRRAWQISYALLLCGISFIMIYRAIKV